MTAEQAEQLAIRCRAETGIVPYRLWIQLSGEARASLGKLTLTGARRLLARQAKATAAMHPDDAALADLTRSDTL